MKLFISIQTVPSVLKYCMEGHVQYHSFTIEIPDDKIPQLVKEAVYTPTEDKFVVYTSLLKE